MKRKSRRLYLQRVLSRLGIYLFCLWGVLSLNFFLIRLLPGGPFEVLFGPDSQTALVLDSETKAELLKYYQLDQPLGKQYLHYLAQTFQGNLGFGIYFQKPVSTLLRERLPWSLWIIFSSTFISLLIALFFASLSALSRHHKLDQVFLIFFLFLSSLPVFLVAMLFLVCFSVKLGWLPLAGAVNIIGEKNFLFWLKDVLLHSLGPISVLTLAETPNLYLIARSSMFTALDQPWMEFGFLRGLRSRRIIIAYLLPAGTAPVITRLGIQIAFLLAGTVFVEMIFSYPGLGRLLFQAVELRDYPVMQGVFLIMTLVVLGVNFVIDLSYQWLDPRVREE